MHRSGERCLTVTAEFQRDLSYLSTQARAVPIVLINRTLEGFSSVSIDHVQAGRMACDLAFTSGGDSICAVWDSRFHVATNLRRTAFEARSEELGIASAISHFTCEGVSDAGYTLAAALLQNNALKKVLYCNNESIARGVVSALLEAGVQIGSDLFLFTANNGGDTFCRYLTPPVTEIHLRMREVFEQGLKRCLRLIAHPGEETKEMLLQPTVIYRQSLPQIGVV